MVREFSRFFGRDVGRPDQARLHQQGRRRDVGRVLRGHLPALQGEELPDAGTGGRAAVAEKPPLSRKGRVGDFLPRSSQLVFIIIHL